jgi:integrase
MRRRYQHGSISKVGKVWIAQWREHGRKRKRTLGNTRQTTKAEAQAELAAILAPINRADAPQVMEEWRFGDFVNQVYLPFYERKWKLSTVMTNRDRIRRDLIPDFSERMLPGLTRDELQAFLDSKAGAGLSFSTVDHMRWDLKQILAMAVAEGHLQRNPAALLFTPREARRYPKARMSREEVRLMFSVLQSRELLVAMLATITGMRPGEIFALKWHHVAEDHIDIKQRIYRGKVDSPKTRHSVRAVGISPDLRAVLDKWRTVAIDTSEDAWVFPSERLKNPISKDNCWRRHMAPKLKGVGLGWTNFQVMRRTHASLMRELDVDPKVVADQLGHTLDVSMNIYTSSPLERRKEAVNTLETALRVM